MRVLHQESRSEHQTGYVLGAPVKIGEREFVMAVVVTESRDRTSLYVHEVILKEKLRAAIKTADRPDQSPAYNTEAKLGAIKSVVQNIYAVNPDNVSQAIDANGEPLVVYQGGKVDFDRFDPLRTSNEGGLLFFTDSPQLASLYAEHGGLPRRAHTFVDPDDILPQVKPVFLSIRHPLVADARGGTKDDIEGYYDLVDSVSYGRRVVNGRLTDETITVDGLILKNVVDMPNQALHLPSVPSTVIAVRTPNQAKSSIGNQGTFSADSDAL